MDIDLSLLYSKTIEEISISGKYNLPEEYIDKNLVISVEDIAVDGKIYVNDEEVDDSFAKGITNDFSIQEENGLVKIPANKYYLIGDNREVSLDSRVFGPVSKEDIKGKASIRIWPLNKIKSLSYKK